MTEQKQVILQVPSKGLFCADGPASIGDEFSALPTENTEWISGNTPRKRSGNAPAVTTISSPASVEPRAIHNYTLSNGTQIIMVYERGAAGVTKKIYYATAGTWTWATLTEGWTAPATDLVLASSRTPRFLTARDYLFFSQGDNTNGLIHWSGVGDAARTIDDAVDISGTDYYFGISARFLLNWKERIVGANGYYYDTLNHTGWSASRLSSGLFFSSLTYSDGTVVQPYQGKGWWENWKLHKKIRPQDGSEIVALWLNKQEHILVAKGKGIFVVYGDDPARIVIEQITDIGLESDHSLQEFNNGYIFKNKDGIHFFDGQNRPQLIDRAIRNLTVQIPVFDIGGEADVLEFELDSYVEWNAANSGLTANIRLDSSGYIELEKFADAERMAYGGSVDHTYNVPQVGTYGRLGFCMYFRSSDAPTHPQFILTSVRPRLSRGVGSQSGIINFAIHKANEDYGVGEQLGSTVSVDINDISQSAAYYEVDFSSDGIELDGNYYLMCYWEENSITTLNIYTHDVTDRRPVVMRFLNGFWHDWYWDERGILKVYGTPYKLQGHYQSSDDQDLTNTPTQWGIFEVDDEERQKIVYRMRSSSDKITWTPTDFSYANTIITPGQQIDKDKIPINRYLDVKITMDRINGSLSPKVSRFTINAMIDSTELTDRLAYSTVFEDRYIFSTNKNLDGEYRSFVLDKEGRWNIYPNQLIRGYVDIDNEKHLLTIDTNAKLHRMFRGVTAEDFKYDYSGNGITGVIDDWYFQKLATKKFHCGYLGILKLFANARLSIGSVFSAGYVNGIVKYKIDDGDWITRYFQDNTDVGDIAVIELTFPAGTRGYTIQFLFETYVDGTSHYGHPFNIQSIVLYFNLQPGLRPIKRTQRTALTDTGYLIE